MTTRDKFGLGTRPPRVVKSWLTHLEELNDRERAAVVEHLELERLRPISRYEPPKKRPRSAERLDDKRLKALLDAIDGKDG